MRTVPSYASVSLSALVCVNHRFLRGLRLLDQRFVYLALGAFALKGPSSESP
jgi:hypothetical protein